jgi:hypothetical protein
MPAPKPPHDISLMLTDYLFKALFGPGYVVRIQMGMVFNINTDPLPDPRQKYGHGYTAITVLVPGQSLAPLARPQSPVAAADLLP